MKPADIWITLRLPTRVSPSKPAFSLSKERAKSYVSVVVKEHGDRGRASYTDTDDPVPVPNIPENNMPTPWNKQ